MLINYIQALLSGATVIPETYRDSPKFVTKVKEPKLSETILQQDHQPANDRCPTGQVKQSSQA